MDERYGERRQEFEGRFSRANRTADSERTFGSPSGNFCLETSDYLTRPNTCSCSRGVVKRIADGTTIADVKRNYGIFWHSWVQHANGCEYLLCGEDYQGYSVINLTEERCITFFPDEGYQGRGFCWTAAYASPDSLVLAVDGCYWACPSEVVLYDFREPESLPLRELARTSNVVDQCEGWIDNETFVMKREVERRRSDGALYESLDEVEQAVLDADPTLVASSIEVFQIKRPPF